MNIRAPQTFSDLVGFRAQAVPSADGFAETHGTTVLALRYKGGVLVLADRRATMGNLIMYDHAEKVMTLDDSTVVAISGSFARSVEICRMLKHSFKYFRRTQLQEMSVAGKLQEISKALAENMPMAMQGIGMFIPIVAAFDASTDSIGIYSFDPAGARFLSGDYASAGSGSERIRGIFEYLSRTEKPWNERPLGGVLEDGLRMLDIAAELDSATGGFAKVLPMATILDAQGARSVPEKDLQAAAEKVLKATR